LYVIKRLAGFVGEYLRSSLLAPFFVLLEVILDVLIPFIMADMIDYGIEVGNMAVVAKYGILLIAMAIVALICGALSGRYCADASTGFAANLRRGLFDRVQEFSFANIDKFSTASIVTRMTTDVSNIQMAFMMIVRTAARCPSMLILALIMTIRIDVRIALIFLVMVPILGIGLYFIMSRAHNLFEIVFKAYDKLNNVVQENLYGIRVVKSFVREDHEVDKFDQVSERIYALFSKAEKILVLNAPLMQFCIYCSMLLIAWFGAHLVVGGDMTTGELVSVFTYVMQILMSLMMLAMVFVMIVISKASAIRVVEVLDEEIDLVNPAEPVYEVKDGSISFENVDFSYSKDPEKCCLSGINLEIKSGETVGIIGGTGSSKSSFVQLIPRLYDVTDGSVKVGGVDVRDYDIETLRNSVSMVLQNNVLFSGTIKENLRWGNPEATDEEIVEACKLAQAHDFVMNFPDQYDYHVEQGGTNVSGGQKQRLCIARALLKKPAILILDDSTSAVDTHTDALIRLAFRERIPNTTKLIIAQRISSVQDADKIIVLDGGKIVNVGTHDELLAVSPIYQEVYTSQQKGVISDGE